MNQSPTAKESTKVKKPNKFKESTTESTKAKPSAKVKVQEATKAEAKEDVADTRAKGVPLDGGIKSPDARDRPALIEDNNVVMAGSPILDFLCDLKLTCKVLNSTEDNNDIVPVIVTLVNLLNQLNFVGDLEDLDRLPESQHKNVTTNQAGTDEEQCYRILPLCRECDRRFLNGMAYYSHLQSAEHKTSKVKNEVTCGVADVKTTIGIGQMAGLCEEKSMDPIESQATHIETVSVGETQPREVLSTERGMDTYSVMCRSCQHTWHSRYLYAQHLVSGLQIDQMEIIGDVDLEVLMAPLKPYHCHLCVTYCDSHKMFLDHLSSQPHNEAVDRLSGKMTCDGCSLTSTSKKDIYLHYESVHVAIDPLSEPCVLRETVCERIQCRFCTKTFKSSLCYNIHLNVYHCDEAMLHAPGNKWCFKCEKEFSTPGNLMQHIKRKHNRTNSYRCSVCDKDFSYSNNLDLHYTSKKHLDNMRAQDKLDVQLDSIQDKTPVHTQQKGVNIRIGERDNGGASQSDKEFSLLEYNTICLQRGRGRPKKQQDLDVIYWCALCGYKYQSEALLERHLKSQYHDNMKQEAARSEESFSCPVCERNFYCEKRYSLHKLSHTSKGKVGESGVKRNKRLRGVPEKYHEFAKHLPKNVTSEVQCPECNKWYKANTVLPHILCKHSVNEELPYKCNFCPRAFCSNSSLYRHHKKHLDIKSFSCKICSKSFRSKSDVNSHQYIAHKELDIKPKIQCNICGAGFMQGSRLKSHMQERHEKKVFKFWCSHVGCHRSFVHKQQFLVHMRGHTGEKPYLCDYCGFSTKTKVQLKRHERIHYNIADYKCKYCTYSSRNSAGLRRHKRLHTGAKPYRCPHCEHRCYSHTNIRIHINNSHHHPGLKLYNCQHCPFASNVTTGFQRHMFEAHSVRPEEMPSVAQYCGVYIPELDITEVPLGVPPLTIQERKVKRKGPPQFRAIQPRTARNTWIIREEEESRHTIIMQTIQHNNKVKQVTDGAVEEAMEDAAYTPNNPGLTDQVMKQEKKVINNVDNVRSEQFALELVERLVKSGSQNYRIVPVAQSSKGEASVIISEEGPSRNSVTTETFDDDQLVILEQESDDEPPSCKQEDNKATQEAVESIIIIEGQGQQQQHRIYMQEGEQLTTIEQLEEQENIHPNVKDAKRAEDDQAETVVATETVNEVYMATHGTELKDLIQGIEDTGGVVELRMEDELNIPDGQPGEVVQVIGPDNQPVQFYYM